MRLAKAVENLKAKVVLPEPGGPERVGLARGLQEFENKVKHHGVKAHIRLNRECSIVASC